MVRDTSMGALAVPFRVYAAVIVLWHVCYGTGGLPSRVRYRSERHRPCIRPVPS
jgi:hypothetical protein